MLLKKLPTGPVIPNLICCKLKTSKKTCYYPKAFLGQPIALRTKELYYPLQKEKNPINHRTAILQDVKLIMRG